MKANGFIDLQVNGFKGIDFSSPDLTLDKVVHVTHELVRQGTAGYLPTVVTSPMHIYEHNLPLLAQAMELDATKDRILGLHLEGPFISREAGIRGAHNPSWIIPPDISRFNRYMELAKGRIRMLTIAADVPGAEDLCRHATKMGVAVSLGHHNATSGDLERMVEAGAKSLTHLGNGIPEQIPRHENPVFAGLANDDLSAMIITDGHHLPLSLIKTIIRAKGISGIVIVSDSSPIAGLPPGEYEALSNRVRLEPDGKLFNPETGYLVGSSATMKQCIEFLERCDFLTEEDLVTVGFRNPLELIGVSSDNFIQQNHT